MKASNGYEELVDQWKATYGKIYKSTVDDNDYIWRKIKRAEYKNIIISDGAVEDIGTNGEIEFMVRAEKIAKAIILWPTNIEDVLEDNVGLAQTIAEEAMKKSGFSLSKTEEL